MVTWALGSNEKWSNSTYVLQVEPTVFWDGLDVQRGEQRDKSIWIDALPFIKMG